MPSRFHARSLAVIALSGLASLWSSGAVAGWLGLPKSGIPTPSFATPTDAPDAAPPSPNEAAERAQQQNNGGQVLSVERVGDGYRVKLMKEGDIKIVYLPD